MINNGLTSYADSIVMLTNSNWLTELRSNRYHYSIRFSKNVPVIFVQPDLSEQCYEFETIDLHNIKILHIYSLYGMAQVDLFNQALRDLKIIKPIFWIYNGYFEKIIDQRYSVLNVFHATEDYFTSESRVKIKDPTLLNSYNKVLLQCDLVVAVSDGVKESIESNTEYNGHIIVASNGCDYKFYEPNQYNLTGEETCQTQDKIVLYQGNIFDKIDYDLMYALANKMPDWRFYFCGKVVFNEPEWENLCKLSNVKYIGLLSPEELRAQCYRSTVGIIPFVQSEWLVKRSLPLKAFEYLASGLSVVTIPIQSLLPYSEVLEFASNVDEFEIAIRKAAKLRFDEAHLKLRLNAAARQDYDLKFRDVTKGIENQIDFKKSSAFLNIAVLYDSSSINISTIREHLISFNLFSRHNIYYLPASQGIKCPINLDLFDSIVIHYSIRLSVPDGNYCLSPSYVNAIQNYIGYKILILQDEYEGTENARNWISNLGIHMVYTTIPEQHIEKIYPKSRFPHVEFINILTGFVPTNLPSMSMLTKTVNRKKIVGYRGRALPYWYGTLGQEKLKIGVKFKNFCLAKGLNVDIEWEHSKRIYGVDWYNFISDCRAMLGTESGSNVFDFDGSIRATIEYKLKENPGLSYSDIYDECIAPHEIFLMNQISPKIFEAIALKTALILFEGEYSNVITPHLHYIVLKKDFSNIQDVFKKLNDDDYIEEMTERAYKDIVLSKKYSYEYFINEFDKRLSLKVRKNILVKKQIHSSIGFISSNNECMMFASKNNAILPSKELFSLEQLKRIAGKLTSYGEMNLIQSKDVFEMCPSDDAVLINEILSEISLNLGGLGAEHDLSKILEANRNFILKTITASELYKIIVSKSINKTLNLSRKLLPSILKTLAKKCVPVAIKHPLKTFFVKLIN